MAAPKLRLFHYWRSTSSWRVRWGLAIKGIPFESVHVNLLNDETLQPAHQVRNPTGYVPVLERLDSGSAFQYIAESVAILEWLEETTPTPSLFSAGRTTDIPGFRARARQLAEVINAGTQPIQNLAVLEHLTEDLEQRKKWSQHWIRQGLGAYERLIGDTQGRYSLGDAITYPDLFVVPQCYNALRQDINLEEFPKVASIYSAALKDPHCIASHPDRYEPGK